MALTIKGSTYLNLKKATVIWRRTKVPLANSAPTLSFLYKKLLYKKVEAEICEKLRNF